jgi:hypothetical protein
MSPKSLRRFLLSDDASLGRDAGEDCSRLALSIPENIVEDNEDDENFATSAVSESALFTGLSPPPSQRGQSRGSSSATLLLNMAVPEPLSRAPPSVPDLDYLRVPRTLPPLCESSWYSPTSPPTSPDWRDPPSFVQSEDEDEDALSAFEDEAVSLRTNEAEKGSMDRFASNLATGLSTYSLPRTSLDDGKLTAATRNPLAAPGSPALIARDGTDVPVGNTSLLADPAEAGVSDLVHDLGWIAEFIQGREI